MHVDNILIIIYTNRYIKVTINILEDKTEIYCNGVLSATIPTISRSSFRWGKVYMSLASHNQDTGAVQFNLKKGTKQVPEIPETPEIPEPVMQTVTFISDNVPLARKRL